MAVGKAAFDAAQRKPCLDLRTRAVDDHRLGPQRLQQGHVVEQAFKIAALADLATKGEHEHPPHMGVDIGRGGAQGADEIGRVHGPLL